MHLLWECLKHQMFQGAHRVGFQFTMVIKVLNLHTENDSIIL